MMTDGSDRQWELLFSPTGADWSGRARYAAAMALHMAGEMPVPVLEIYRICSRLDHEDALDVIARYRTDPVWLAKARALKARLAG